MDREITTARIYAKAMGLGEGDYQLVIKKKGRKEVVAFNLSPERAEEWAQFYRENTREDCEVVVEKMSRIW